MESDTIRKPRVLVMASTFPRWKNDSEPAFVFELSRRLSDEFDITVLSPRSPGSLVEESMGGLKVIRFPYFLSRWENLATHSGGILNRLRANPFNYLLVPFFLLGQMLALIRLLHKERFDLIHAHWLIPQGLIAVIGLLLTRKPIPLVCTSHGGDLFALKARIFQRLKRWVMDNSAALTVVSRAMKETVVDMGVAADKVQVIPMGVDLKNNFIPDTTVLRKTDELLFVGRLVEKKGVSYLLEAMPAVLKKFPSIRLNIAGSGPMEKDLNQQIQRLDLSGKVTFLGMVHQSELPGLYQRATLAVFPFIIAESGDQEGFGLVQVEAMGCECPVITGDLPAIHDIVTHEVNGLIFPSGNTKALADSIIRLLADPGFRESLANEGRTRAAEMFDWDIIAQGYAGVYKQLLNNWWSV